MLRFDPSKKPKFHLPNNYVTKVKSFRSQTYPIFSLLIHILYSAEIFFIHNNGQYFWALGCLLYLCFTVVIIISSELSHQSLLNTHTHTCTHAFFSVLFSVPCYFIDGLNSFNLHPVGSISSSF